MVPATNVVNGGSPIDRPVAVWIEDGDGAIVRGVADSVTAGGAHVRLAGRPGFESGAGVALPVCFDPEQSIVATTARVSWVRTDSGEPECGLEWIERSTVEEWLAARN